VQQHLRAEFMQNQAVSGPTDGTKRRRRTAPRSPTIAASAALLGQAELGPGVRLAPGAVVRSHEGGVTLGAGSVLLENGVIVGTAEEPVRIGRKTFFGHRALVMGACVGDLSEIGNAAILMPGARLGCRVFLGEGTLVPPGAVIPDDAVVVGRPARVVRRVGPADIARLERLRDLDLSLPPDEVTPTRGRSSAGATMGKLYSYRGRSPRIAASAVLFDSAEITGDVTVGEGSIIGAGVKILGDSHGPVRIGARVQILENTVLHLLPDNELVIEDGVIVGPGATIHGCHIGAGSVVEPGAIVCDWSHIGRGCLVRAGALVKQRSSFGDGVVIGGFPASAVGALEGGPPEPLWALRGSELASLVRVR
jgi:carbonic anhydrase/acetyltransferase-like protein (isoleucine patch superfamily)